jgi:hypothetical protein
MIPNQSIFRKERLQRLPDTPLDRSHGIRLLFGQSLYKKYSCKKTQRVLITLGVLSILLFIVIRLSNTYGDPKPWSEQMTHGFTFLSFFNVTKYPPSLLFILMTLGPAKLFLAFAENPLSKLTSIISTFGRVPLFYYLLHLYLLHLLAMLAAELTGFGWSSMVLSVWITDDPSLDGYGFSLLITYLIWLGIVASLYPLCKWYDRYKTANKQKAVVELFVM